MKNFIKFLSFLAIILATALFIIVGLGNLNNPKAFAYFPYNKPQAVNFEIDPDSFSRLSEREQEEQLRDWLLLTITSDKKFTASDLNNSLYDLSPIRYGYMKPVSNFQYGGTRSLYMGEGKVIALLSQGISQQAELDALADIVDKHRQNLGKKPTTIEVFEYEVHPEQQNALLTYKQQLNAEKFFTDKQYGYVEAQVTNLTELETFFQQFDALTFAQVNDSSITLGGRKISGHSYGKMRVEDIAAIWQSEKKINDELEQWKSQWETKLNALPADTTQAEISELQEKAIEEGRKLKLVNGSGFSLDPSYDYSSFAQDFAKIKSNLQSLAKDYPSVITLKDIQDAEQGLQKKDEVPYLILADKLRNSDNSKIALSGDDLFSVGESYHFQAARYDGDLQGTEVGMVLFYTDLLAKLWALDYLETTPSQSIFEFQPLTEKSATISSIYQQELKELPNTRLWFGYQDKGFQIADNNNSILFGRNATRVYAASSNLLKPGKETTARPDSEAFLGWWNDHYKEVARYEPQYERLNEIMKWSLVISWLNESENSHLLDFLQDVQVKHDYWFPDWVQANKEQLKFQDWDSQPCASKTKTYAKKPVCFYPQGYKGTKTEALPLLQSTDFTRFGKLYSCR